MPTTFAEITSIVAERLITLASQDAELKGQLRRLALAFLELTEETPHQPSQETLGAAQVAEHVHAAIEQLEVAVSSAAGPVDQSPASTALPELTLGRSTFTEPALPTFRAPATVVEDLALIESRTRLKAEASRWAASRRRQMAEGASFYTEIDPVDREIIAKAKELPNCFLWMCHSTGPNPSNLALYEEVAGSFEAVADAVSLIRQIQDEPEADQGDFEAALDLLAESQSALRVAVGTIEGPPDSDQNAVFHWLKATASETQIFIRNYMRLDNPADPAQWQDILNRIEEVAQRVQEARRRRSERKRMLGKVRHKTSLILNDPDRAASEWDLLIGTVCELIGGGLPPSNRELRELLLPAIDLLPEKEIVPWDFERVLVEIDRYLATIPPPETPVAVKPTKEVTEAAALLSGKSLMLIGGDKRPGAYQALKESLGLKELIWIDTRAHESVEGFAPYVARSDVAAVLLAIRWSSHSFGEIKSFCDNHGKPLIRLPGGYNPNQVAAQIMAQASDRLG